MVAYVYLIYENKLLSDKIIEFKKTKLLKRIRNDQKEVGLIEFVIINNIFNYVNNF
jgi:hypothetical protein